jgi:hypothetical protein
MELSNRRELSNKILDYITKYANGHLDAGNSLEPNYHPIVETQWGTRLIAEPNGNNVVGLDNPQRYYLSPLW